MSNCEVFDLGNIEVEPHHVKEVLRCVFHTILFNRALGFVRPMEADCELFDATYVYCSDPELERQVEARLSEICTAVGRQGNNADALKVSLAFFEKMKRQQGWFGGNQERKMFWERWQLNLQFIHVDPRGALSPMQQQQQHQLYQPQYLQQQPQQQQYQQSSTASQISEQIEDLLGTVAALATGRRDHIPPVGGAASPLTFPFEISFNFDGAGKTGRLPIPLPPSVAASIGGGVQAVRKLLVQAPPPPNIL